jgi:hypothetical protein
VPREIAAAGCDDLQRTESVRSAQRLCCIVGLKSLEVSTVLAGFPQGWRKHFSDKARSRTGERSEQPVTIKPAKAPRRTCRDQETKSYLDQDGQALDSLEFRRRRSWRRGRCGD